MCVNSSATDGLPSIALTASPPSGTARSKLTRMALFRSQESSSASGAHTDDPETTAGRDRLFFIQRRVLAVAEKLDVDASMVSRVANGKRRHAVIDMALREELISVRKTLAEFLVPSSGSVFCADKTRRE